MEILFKKTERWCSFSRSLGNLLIFIFECLLMLFSASSGCCDFVLAFNLLFSTNGCLMTLSWEIFVGKAILEKIGLAFSFECHGS